MIAESNVAPGVSVPPDPVGCILIEIGCEFLSWLAFIETLELRLYRVAMDGPRSARDVFVHVTSWNEYAVQIARDQVDPTSRDPGPTRGPAGILHINVHEFDATKLAALRPWSPGQIETWAIRVQNDLREAVLALPVGRVINGNGKYGARMWLWGPAVVHSRRHRLRVEHLANRAMAA